MGSASILFFLPPISRRWCLFVIADADGTTSLPLSTDDQIVFMREQKRTAFKSPCKIPPSKHYRQLDNIISFFFCCCCCFQNFPPDRIAQPCPSGVDGTQFISEWSCEINFWEQRWIHFIIWLSIFDLFLLPKKKICAVLESCERDLRHVLCHLRRKPIEKSENAVFKSFM